MSKKLILTYFCLGFIDTYLIMSFYISGLRLGLIAPPLEFFLKSVSSTWLFKLIISILVGLIIAGIYILLKKHKKNTKGLMLVLVIIFVIVIIGALHTSIEANRF